MSDFPPYAMQVRAWECANVLMHQFRDRLSEEEQSRIAALWRRAPETLTRAEAGDLTATHIVTVGVRV